MGRSEWEGSTGLTDVERVSGPLDVELALGDGRRVLAVGLVEEHGDVARNGRSLLLQNTRISA